MLVRDLNCFNTENALIIYIFIYKNVRLRYLSVIALRAHESLISEHDKFVRAKCVLILLKGFIAHIFINV